MTVNEIFYSLQGEGLLTGVPSVFIRLPGCPLRCKWCDTKYAWDPTAGIDYTIEKIIDTVQQSPCRFVVITGGEPMTNPQLPELAQKLKSRDKHITIETAGVAFIPDLPCDLMSISPKLSNSTPADKRLASVHEKTRLNIPAIRQLTARYKYQLKFVVESPDDLPEIRKTIDQIGNIDPEKIMLMPQAQTRDELIAKSPAVAELCKRTGFTFCQRLQIILWNNARGK
jgi:7-carboxy-7-deazaguanine synthase